MSASTSCSDRGTLALENLRRGLPVTETEIRALGEDCPAEFFRLVVEALADSFDPADVARYNQLMRVWIPPAPPVTPILPSRVDRIYVLSRVTLGSDIKITSGLLAALKHRFPAARIILVGSRKSAEIFAADPRIEHLEANYPRSGPVSGRLAFAHDLRRRLEAPHRIVVDPDSRITQLGLVPVCEPEHAFHFPSRTAGAATSQDLSRLAAQWFRETFGESPTPGPYIAPTPVAISGNRPRAAVSLGVGGNQTKRIPGDFETRLIRLLAERFHTLWIDRGAGGEEAARVTAAVENSGMADRVQFWEGSFAGFASLIAQSDLYLGYDSAGQHAAAATRTPLITLFAGAPSPRFRHRWQPAGEGSISLLDADSLTPDLLLAQLSRLLP